MAGQTIEWTGSHFRAVCKYHDPLPDGTPCYRQRVNYEYDGEAKAQPSRGRPGGHLTVWSLAADIFATREEHMKGDEKIDFCWANRKGARAILKEAPGARELLSKEWERRKGEPEEPRGGE